MRQLRGVAGERAPSTGSEPAGSFGVMEQDTTPLAFVVPEHDCVPFSVSVTGSLAAPALV